MSVPSCPWSGAPTARCTCTDSPPVIRLSRPGERCRARRGCVRERGDGEGQIAAATRRTPSRRFDIPTLRRTCRGRTMSRSFPRAGRRPIRHCEERSDEAIWTGSRRGDRDCFAALAMTWGASPIGCSRSRSALMAAQTKPPEARWLYRPRRQNESTALMPSATTPACHQRGTPGRALVSIRAEHSTRVSETQTRPDTDHRGAGVPRLMGRTTPTRQPDELPRSCPKAGVRPDRPRSRASARC